MKFRLNNKNKYLILAGLIILTLALVQLWLNYNSPESKLKRLVKAAPLINQAYQVDGVSLKLGQNDPNGLLVQVGNATAKEFLPELNLSRWDGEVNFKMQATVIPAKAGIQKDDSGSPIRSGMTNDKLGMNFDHDKIKYGTLDQEYEFYQSIATSTDGAGYNFDVVLKTKPAGNVFSFNIETKNLDFFYQPPLNQEKQKELSSEYSELSSKGHIVSCTETDCFDKDGKVITHRPENVVGSYAVYYKGGKSGDYTALGGKNYRAGKAFHIYRPQIIDAQGNKVWATMNVDTANNKLTVTIPQDFLDSAVYPVTIDPTFGYTMAPTSYYEQPPTQTYFVQIDNLSPSGNNSLTGIVVYINPQTTSDNLQFGWYSNSSNYPNSRLVYDSVAWNPSSSGVGWYKTPNNWNYPLTASTQYWGAFKNSSNNYNLYYDSAGGSKWADYQNATMPDPASATQDFQAHFPIYAIYSASTPTNVYYSVGQNTSNHKTGSPTLTIDSSGVGTFSVAQTASTTGVGDVVTYGGAVAYISGKQSQTVWTLVTASGATPSATTSASVSSIAHAFASLYSALQGGVPYVGDASHMGTTDLTSAGGGYILNIPCYYDTASDTTAVTISGYTTDATHYIKIYTPNNTATEVNRSQRHNGKWDDRKYVLSMNGDANTAITISASYVKIDGLQIKFTKTNNLYYYGIGSALGGTGVISISNNILTASCLSTCDNSSGIDLEPGSSGMVFKIWNNIIYGWIRAGASNLDGIFVQPQVSDTDYVYNNTAYNNYRGITTQSFGAVVAKNNLAYNNTTDYSGSLFDSTCTNNLSKDATAPAYNTYYINKTVLFTDSANNDFHLASTDTGAKGYGTNLSADTNLSFLTDIDNQTRPAPTGAGWDIGADQFQALPIYRSVGPGPNTSALASSTGATMTIDNNTTTFSSGLAANVGVGDVIVYNGYSTTAKNSVAFISGRTNSTTYTVQDVGGRTASSTYGSTNWQVFRAYTSLCNAVDSGVDCTAGYENTGIPLALRDFDPGPKNLASTTQQFMVAAYADAEDTGTNVSVSGWTTATSTYIKIYTPYQTSDVGTSQRHSGKANTGYKITNGSGNGEWTLGIAVPYVWIDGLEVTASHAADYGGIAPMASTGWIKISNSLVHDATGSGGTGHCILEGGAAISQVIYIWNNIIYNCNKGSAGNGIGFDSDGASAAYIYNNTISDVHDYGIFTYGSILRAKNNIVRKAGTAAFGPGTFHSDSDYNASDDNSSPGSHSKNGVRVQFVNAANKDFHLAQGDAAAIDNGANLSADSYLSFTDDIDGELRRGKWAIGADQQNQRPVKINTVQSDRYASGLVGEWTFDAPTIYGNNIYDQSGHYATGTMSGSPTKVAGINGQALKFDGADDYVETTSVTGLPNTKGSMSMWVYLKSKPPGASNSSFLELSDGTTGNNEIYFYIDGSNLYFLVEAGGSFKNVWQWDQNNVNIKQWYHFVVNWDTTTDTYSVYGNGSLITPDGTNVTGDPSGINTVDIGGRNNGGGSYSDYFNGFIDEVRIYNRALGTDEIKKLYTLGSAKINASQNSKITNGLVGEWSFNGNDMGTTSAIDRSGNNNTGWLYSGVKKVVGKLGQALSFDGVDDYVDAGTSNVFNLSSSPFSVGVWIKPNDFTMYNGATPRIVIKRTDANNGWMLNLDSTVDTSVCSTNSVSFVMVRSGTSAPFVCYNGPALSTGQWYYVVGVSDGTNLSIYINGSLASVGTEGVSYGLGSLNNLSIGWRSDGSGYYNGLIDEVRIYNRALTADEIKRLYNMGR